MDNQYIFETCFSHIIIIIVIIIIIINIIIIIIIIVQYGAHGGSPAWLPRKIESI